MNKRDLGEWEEHQYRLYAMAVDKGDTWDLSDNDQAACNAGGDAIMALMSRAGETCSRCAHYDANSSATEGVGYCTNPNSWHRAKAMPPHEMCSKWVSANE